MKKALFPVLVAVYALGVSGPTLAQDTADLAGTWTAKTNVLLISDGKVVEAEREYSFVIERVSGALIQGYRAWEAISPPDQIGYVGEEQLTQAREPFIGVVSADNETIHMVETEDRGSIMARILGANQIEIIYTENAPHAVVHSAIYSRVD
ncbi:MAG: hypothetical protein AAGJ94_05515 [Pseudomonadota bacterium]